MRIKKIDGSYKTIVKESVLTYIADIPVFFEKVVQDTTFTSHGVIFGPKLLVKITGTIIVAVLCIPTL